MQRYNQVRSISSTAYLPLISLQYPPPKISFDFRNINLIPLVILLGNFILEYTYMHPNLQPFVIIQLAQVLAMLTKLGWFDLDEFKNVHGDLNQFLQVCFVM